MSDIAIKIEGLKKQYRLGAINGGTLSADLESWWARKRGKEDPNTIVGTNSTNVGQLFYALNGIDLEVKKGEALGVIGANGAGKSTLLKLLSRVTAPTEGKISINGRITSMLEVGTGFHPELTGRENIYMNGAILGMTKDEIDRKMEDIIEFSECRQFINTPVKRYSSGMYVKLAFSVAAHLDSEIIIMDEVLAVGDVKFQTKCLQKIRDVVNKEGRTALYVSHNMNTIQQLCDRCIVLSHGKKIYDGEVDEGIKKYFNTEFGGSAKLDLKKAPRFDLNTQYVTMEEFEFVNHESITFNMGETIRCRLRIKYHKDMDELFVKFMIRYVDGTIAGLYTLPKIEKGEKGEVRDIYFDMKLTNLAPGNYDFRMALIELMNNGQEVGHDTLQYYGKINIVERPEDINYIKWLHGTYGHTYFGELKRINV